MGQRDAGQRDVDGLRSQFAVGKPVGHLTRNADVVLCYVEGDPVIVQWLCTDADDRVLFVMHY